MRIGFVRESGDSPGERIAGWARSGLGPGRRPLGGVGRVAGLVALLWALGSAGAAAGYINHEQAARVDFELRYESLEDLNHLSIWRSLVTAEPRPSTGGWEMYRSHDFGGSSDLAGEFSWLVETDVSDVLRATPSQKLVTPITDVWPRAAWGMQVASSD